MPHDPMHRLQREMRVLRLYAAALTLAFVAVLLTAFKAPDPHFERLTVERLDIVDADGASRVVLANQQRFPPPMLNGETFKRAVTPAGLVFYDRRGNEVGGLALTDVEGGKVSALAFDNPNMDAIGLMTRIGADGEPISSGLQINQAVPSHVKVLDAAKQATRRIVVQNERNDAEILLADASGKDRIRLRVDRDGDARIEVLDADGRVVFSAPEAVAQKP
ncbi:hypothetical protein [Pseudoxanthomonas sp.]|jgi:hypothetical protein|uniref:hypothetical protein n=1 Tax=Pseudoxanthomonas sp. TaxID=1871049 RepID=UPI002FDFCF47